MLFQLFNNGSIALLTTGITFHMLKKTAKVPKLGLASRAFVLVVLIPPIGVMFALITFVGQTVNCVATDTTMANSRFHVDQHG